MLVLLWEYNIGTYRMPFQVRLKDAVVSRGNPIDRRLSLYLIQKALLGRAIHALLPLSIIVIVIELSRLPMKPLLEVLGGIQCLLLRLLQHLAICFDSYDLSSLGRRMLGAAIVIV